MEHGAFAWCRGCRNHPVENSDPSCCKLLRRLIPSARLHAMHERSDATESASEGSASPPRGHGQTHTHPASFPSRPGPVPLAEKSLRYLPPNWGICPDPEGWIVLHARFLGPGAGCNSDSNLGLGRTSMDQGFCGARVRKNGHAPCRSRRHLTHVRTVSRPGIARGLRSQFVSEVAPCPLLQPPGSPDARSPGFPDGSAGTEQGVRQ